MIILQAQRILSSVRFNLHARIFNDGMGNPVEPYALHLGALDWDATGSLNGCDVTEAVARLTVIAERKVLFPDGIGWHGVV